jgi:molybdate/tungstate transport system substrate-binding protein
MGADQVIERAALLLLVAGVIFIAGCTSPSQQQTTLKVVAAGSLLYPLETVERDFEASHPRVDVQIEGHGSIQVIRQVTDLHRSMDVVVVADENLIPDMMYHPMENSTFPYADCYAPFATNEMVIAYTNKSLYADEINEENWYEVLSRPEVRVGFSNPMLDAAGYRALMVTLLAEDYYQNTTLFDNIIGNQFDPPLNRSLDDRGAVVTLPTVMRPSTDKVSIRDGSIYLLALLDAGGIDYAYEYRSVAQEHGLRWVTLPPEINLASSDFADRYRTVTIILGFQRFQTIGCTRVGMPIIYGVTVPNNAPHPELAREFARFMVERFQVPQYGWPDPRAPGNAFSCIGDPAG